MSNNPSACAGVVSRNARAHCDSQRPMMISTLEQATQCRDRCQVIYSALDEGRSFNPGDVDDAVYEVLAYARAYTKDPAGHDNEITKLIFQAFLLLCYTRASRVRLVSSGAFGVIVAHFWAWGADSLDVLESVELARVMRVMLSNHMDSFLTVPHALDVLMLLLQSQRVSLVWNAARVLRDLTGPDHCQMVVKSQPLLIPTFIQTAMRMIDDEECMYYATETVLRILLCGECHDALIPLAVPFMKTVAQHYMLSRSIVDDVSSFFCALSIRHKPSVALLQRENIDEVLISILERHFDDHDSTSIWSLQCLSKIFNADMHAAKHRVFLNRLAKLIIHPDGPFSEEPHAHMIFSMCVPHIEELRTETFFRRLFLRISLMSPSQDYNLSPALALLGQILVACPERVPLALEGLDRFFVMWSTHWDNGPVACAVCACVKELAKFDAERVFNTEQRLRLLLSGLNDKEEYLCQAYSCMKLLSSKPSFRKRLMQLGALEHAAYDVVNHLDICVRKYAAQCVRNLVGTSLDEFLKRAVRGQDEADAFDVDVAQPGFELFTVGAERVALYMPLVRTNFPDFAFSESAALARGIAVVRFLVDAMHGRRDDGGPWEAALQLGAAWGMGEDPVALKAKLQRPELLAEMLAPNPHSDFTVIAGKDPEDQGLKRIFKRRGASEVATRLCKRMVFENKFKCHRQVLASRSGFFKGAMAFGCGEVTLNDVAPLTLTVMLHYMYRGWCPDVEKACAQDPVLRWRVLCAAHKYDLPGLQHKCELEIMKNYTEAKREMLELTGDMFLPGIWLWAYSDNAMRKKAKYEGVFGIFSS
jgi:hypothetical protein